MHSRREARSRDEARDEARAEARVAAERGFGLGPENRSNFVSLQNVNIIFRNAKVPCCKDDWVGLIVEHNF